MCRPAKDKPFGIRSFRPALYVMPYKSYLMTQILPHYHLRNSVPSDTAIHFQPFVCFASIEPAGPARSDRQRTSPPAHSPER